MWTRTILKEYNAFSINKRERERKRELFILKWFVFSKKFVLNPVEIVPSRYHRSGHNSEVYNI